MDKKKLYYSPVVSDENDDIKWNNSTRNDYGTSSRDPNMCADEKREPEECLSCRRILYTMMFLGFATAYSLRVSLSEAIVAMVNQTAVTEDTLPSNISYDQQCPRDIKVNEVNGELVWDRIEQGAVLAAFYYGYIATQVRI